MRQSSQVCPRRRAPFPGGGEVYIQIHDSEVECESHDSARMHSREEMVCGSQVEVLVASAPPVHRTGSIIYQDDDHTWLHRSLPVVNARWPFTTTDSRETTFASPTVSVSKSRPFRVQQVRLKVSRPCLNLACTCEEFMTAVLVSPGVSLTPTPFGLSLSFYRVEVPRS